MKLSKKLTVLFLAAACVATLVPATFSWYDHDDSQTGREMSYQRQDLPVSEGMVSLVTKKYRTENNRVFYDKKGNKEYQGDALTSDTVPNGATQYYGTTIINNDTKPAYVNLYLKNFSNNPKNSIGTIAPSLTYKGISSSVHQTNKSMIRVYCQFNNANNWNTSGAKWYVVYTTKSGSRNYKEITQKITAGADNTPLKAKQTEVLGDNLANTYYVDLDDHTTEFYFATDGKDDGFNTGTLSVTQPWYRTKTITDVQSERGYYLTGIADDTTFNAQYASFPVPGGISIMTYFDSLTIYGGQTAYITLANGTNYTGVNATYANKAQDSQVSVNANTGLVSAGSFGTGGSATLTTTVTGSLGDKAEVETAVTCPEFLPSATVAMNVLVPGKTTEKQADGSNILVPGEAEIVWYIENKSGAACQFNNIFYTR